MIRRAALVLGLLILGTPVFAEDTKAMEKAYKRFDSLGYPDCKKLDFVKVATGRWVQYGHEAKRNQFLYGFLLSKNETDFSIFTLELREERFQFKKGPKVAPHDVVSFKKSDFKAFMQSLYKAMKTQKESGEPNFRMDARLGEAAQLFAYSWFCKNRGHKALQTSFFEMLKDLTKGSEQPWEKELIEGQCSGEFWDAIVSFTDPKTSREEILKTFQWLEKHFKGSQYQKRIAASAKILEKMVEEDRGHRTKKIPALEKLALKDRVAELIFQLREQRGSQWSQPGACDIFNDPRGEKSPAAQLEALGFAAIPQLIERVDDKRFTRSMGFHRDFYFSHHILRIGDCAVSIISRIACRRFYSRNYTNGAMVKDGEASAVKKEIQRWWAEVQKKGEKQVLIEGVERGDENAGYQAARLCKKYPQSAAKAIEAGYRKAYDDWTKAALLQQLATLSDPKALSVLKSQLKSAPSLSLRVTAARLLLKKGQKNVLGALIQELNEAKTHEGGLGGLIHVLIESRDAKALDAIVKKRSQLEMNDRLEIIDKIIGLLWTSEDEIAKNLAKFSPEAQGLLEKVLIESLGDEAEEQSSGGWYGKTIQNPRVCDRAGHVLTVIWRKKYSFDLEATLSQRDRDRVLIMNVWRKEQGQALLKVPELPVLPHIPEKTGQELVKRLRAASDEKTVDLALKAFEKTGLASLSLLMKELKEERYSSATRKRMNETAAKIANQLQRVQVKPPTARSEAITKFLKKYKNKLLTDSDFFDILYHFGQKPPKGFKGVCVIAERGAGGVGLELRLQFLKGQKRAQDSWSTGATTMINKDCTYNSFGSCGTSSITEKSVFSSFAKNVKDALKSPAHGSILIRGRLER